MTMTYVQAPRTVPADELANRLCSWAGSVAASEYRWLQLVAEFDRRRLYEQWECRTCAQWLMWQCSLDIRSAHEKVRVARVLESLPVISARFAAGELSYSKVRAITRVATPLDEADWVNIAQSVPTTGVERIVAATRRAVQLNTGNEASCQARRGVTSRFEEDGMVTTIVRLPVDEHALLAKALHTALEPDPQRSAEQRRADALLQILGHYLSGTTDDGQHHPVRTADRYQTVVHVGVTLLTDANQRTAGDPGHRATATGDVGAGSDPGAAAGANADPGAAAGANAEVGDGVGVGDGARVDVHVDMCASTRAGVDVDSGAGTGEGEGAGEATIDGCAVPIDTVKRLCCDGSVVWLVEGPHGEPLGVTTKSRNVSAALRRALLARDRMCRWMGCTNTGWLDAHHLIHWIDGGPTTLDNLLTLCRHHHRAVHEGGWTIDQRADGLHFCSPHGWQLRTISPHVTEVELDIGPAAISPCWYGDPIDLGYITAVLLQHTEPPDPLRSPEPSTVGRCALGLATAPIGNPSSRTDALPRWSN